jgi:hypothetical protein
MLKILLSHTSYLGWKKHLCFQLYVTVSRVKTQGGLKILITDDNDKPKNSTVNVVYAEVFQKK